MFLAQQPSWFWPSKTLWISCCLEGRISWIVWYESRPETHYIIIIEENLLIFLIYDKWRPVVEWYTRGIVHPFCAHCVSVWCLELCLHDLKDLEPIRAECLNGSPPMRGLHYAYLVVEYWEEDERSQASGGQGMQSLGEKIFHEN